MMMTRVTQLLIYGMLLLGGVSHVSLVRGQEQIGQAEWNRGYHGFNMICQSAGMTHNSMDKWRRLSPRNTVLVVFGSPAKIRINIDAYLQRGGAVLIASDQQGSELVRIRHGLGFAAASPHAARDNDMFRGMFDCPIVTDIRSHPCLKNVKSIVTNRPGMLLASRLSTIAFLPALRESQRSSAFMAVVENSNGGKIIGVADDSIFANQMIVYGDNAVFAHQTISWLKGAKRKNMLMMVDGVVQSAKDPSDVELVLPPPTRQEVIDALKNLPPSALLDFGNSVATVVEEENMVNEFFGSSIDKIPDVKLNRGLIFTAFGLVCLAAVVAFVYQKKLMRHTASEVASRRSANEMKNRKSTEAVERQRAAGVLLDSFCVEVGNRRYNDWPSFPHGIPFNDDAQGNAILQSIATASNQYKTNSHIFWTAKRLSDLYAGVSQWREFVRTNPGLVSDSAAIRK